MTEIEGKKYYTWDEIRAMPLGTKARLILWSKEEFIFFRREDSGVIYAIDELGNVPEDIDTSLFYQDRFEIYEEEREYVTGLQALEKLLSGEWKEIACYEEGWKYKYKYICLNPESGIFNDHQECFVDYEIGSNFLKLKRWYEYKEQQ